MKKEKENDDSYGFEKMFFYKRNIARIKSSAKDP
jgi:hypothetical protein